MAAFLALLLAAAAALPAAAYYAARGGEAVTYTPVVQYGDESAAEGIELRAVGETFWDVENDSVNMALSGDRLAVAGNVYESEYSFYDDYLAFFLAVYGPDGLRYRGEYACSLEDIEPRPMACRAFMNEVYVGIRG